MGFLATLNKAWATTNSMLCVGLDPDLDRLPDGIRRDNNGIEDFCRAIVESTADAACAFKPQIAHFAARGAEAQLERICKLIRESHPNTTLILDAKRGDIGSTAEYYAREAFDRYGAHAVTVNPYMGTDSIEPFLKRGAAIVLCRTSNLGGSELQNKLIDGVPVYQHIARTAAESWSTLGEVGLVVGATFPGELAEVRAIAQSLPLLVPGVGAQGGDVEATVRAGRDSNGLGMMINSSRAIIYASNGKDFASQAREVALATRDAINAVS